MEGGATISIIRVNSPSGHLADARFFEVSEWHRSAD
jgi:hypothetical protein